MSKPPVSTLYDDDGERVIDRSGDIDQRPFEEQNVHAANIVPFRAALQSEPQTLAPLHRLEDHSAPSTQVLRRHTPAAAVGEVAQRLQRDLDKQFAKAKAHLEALTRLIDAKEKKCVLPRLDGDLQQVRFQRQKTLIANGPALANHLREERSRLADLERFRCENRISRDAHYPASPILGFGILSLLILLEACINGVLFADSSDRGLFGGWLEAMVLAITNVGVAFLVGYIVVPQVNRRAFLPKAGAILLAIAGFAALILVNLFGAHYRDFKAATARTELTAPVPPAPRREASLPISGQKPGQADAPASRAAQLSMSDAGLKRFPAAEERSKRSEMEALRRVFQAPFELESFTSFFLLIIGLCAATIAAADGYKFDDPFPGYGKCCRRYAEARARSADALRRIMNQANASIVSSFQSIDRKLETHARDIAELQALHQAYAGDWAAMKNALDDASRSGEDDIACHNRLINKIPDRDTLDLYTLSAPTLPPLNEKYAKFYESQEKKLKALQKAVQKEKNESLGVFDAVSADFEKLLAEVAKASLQTASPNVPELARPAA